jgi:hypothetical protein
MSNNITYNIGYQGLGTSGILSKFPQVATDIEIAEMAELIRSDESIDTLWQWSTDNYVPASAMVLHLRISANGYYWEFTVKLINVREYRARWESIYGEWNPNKYK